MHALANGLFEPSAKRLLRHLLAGCAVFLTLIAAVISVRAPAWPNAFVAPAPPLSCVGQSVFDIQPFRQADRYAHAVTAVILRDGRMRAIWYEGFKELSPDVKLWTALYDGVRWTDMHPFLDATQTSEGSGRYVRKLGDPIIFRDANGELVIVFATLGIGGWDGASLKIIRSSDEGQNWSPPQNLTTTAIFNLGANVKGAAVPAAGGFTIVPTSREFVQTFSELVLLDNRGRVVGKRRIGVRLGGTQPFTSVLDEQRAVTFMRLLQGFTLFAKTRDAGQTWTAPAPTTIPAADSPVVVTPIGGGLLMVSSYYDKPIDRWSLNFSISMDEGETWRTIHSRQFGAGLLTKARYPWLIAGPDGLYHLLFTYSHLDGSTELMHGRISRDWIAEQGGPGCP